MKDLKVFPNFKSEAEERDFWLNNDSADYFDLSKATHVNFKNLKPSPEYTTLRKLISTPKSI